MDVVLLAFVAVQASLLFGGVEVIATTDLTYAERARQGFGQLVGVTLLTVALLAWAGRRARPDGRHRTLVAGLGGGLVALTLVVVASALRRMWLYEQAYGWTVLRVNVAVFEIWLAVVLVLVSAAWLLRRTAASARLVVASAGIGMLVLAVIGPDALVARLDVERFTATGKLDAYYLRQLAAESVPALDRLPEPQTLLRAGRAAAADRRLVRLERRTVAGRRDPDGAADLPGGRRGKLRAALTRPAAAHENSW